MIDYLLISDTNKKMCIVRNILESLPEWFEMESGREEYIKDSDEQFCFAALDDGKAVGFLCLKETSKDTVEIAVMGVLKEYHHDGIGTKLFEFGKNIAAEKGYSFMQVKTVKMGMYKSYDITNKFYLSLGFKEFEIFPTLWDEANPCQIYVMSIK